MEESSQEFPKNPLARVKYLQGKV